MEPGDSVLNLCMFPSLDMEIEMGYLIHLVVPTQQL